MEAMTAVMTTGVLLAPLTLVGAVLARPSEDRTREPTGGRQSSLIETFLAGRDCSSYAWLGQLRGTSLRDQRAEPWSISQLHGPSALASPRVESMLLAAESRTPAASRDKPRRVIAWPAAFPRG